MDALVLLFCDNVWQTVQLNDFCCYKYVTLCIAKIDPGAV